MSEIMIYVLDDDAGLNKLIDFKFKKSGISNYSIFTDYKEFFKSLHDKVSISIIDYYLLEEVTGFDVMKKILEVNPSCYIMIMSGMAKIELLIEMINHGNMKKYINKNEKGYLDKLVEHVQEAIKEIKFYNKLLERTTKK